MNTPRLEDLPRYTYDDYVQWEGRWELIQGIPYAMSPAPNILDQSMSQRIAGQLERALENCQNCHALLPVDWRIDEETTVQPDHLVICGALEKTAYLTRAPALIFEILSTSTAYKDRTTKFKLYEQEGVRYDIVVDPNERVAKVYRLLDGFCLKMLDAGNERVEFDLGQCCLAFDFSRIWL